MEGPGDGGEALGLLRWEGGWEGLEVEVRSKAGGFEVLGKQLGEMKLRKAGHLG